MTVIAASHGPPSFSPADTHYNGYNYDAGLKRYPKRVSLVKRHTHTGTLRAAVPPVSRPSPSRQFSDHGPTKKKSVRFRETVEDIKLFYQWQMPNAIRMQPDDQEEDAGDIPRLEMVNWVVPSSTQDRISPDAPVAVENLAVQPSSSLSSLLLLKTMTATATTTKQKPTIMLIGHCCVANLAFEKHVTVRCTFDHWMSFEDIDCAFVESIDGTAVDRFTFSVPWPSKARIAELAMRYVVNGREFWDNNRGKNYRLRLQTKAPEQQQQLQPQQQQSLWYQRSSSSITITPWNASSFWISTNRWISSPTTAFHFLK